VVRFLMVGAAIFGGEGGQFCVVGSRVEAAGGFAVETELKDP